MNKQSAKYRDFVLLALFAAIILLLAFTPIGFIQLPLIKATIVHVPVIIGSILLGPKKGAILGGLFGLTSLISNTMTPTLLSFAFSPAIPAPGTTSGNWLSLVITFIPRILVGIVPYYVFVLLQKLMKKNTAARLVARTAATLEGREAKTLLMEKNTSSKFVALTSEIISLAVAALLGSFTNTVFVMGTMFLLFKDAYAAAKGIPVDAVLGAVLAVVGTNGVPEAIAAVVLTVSIGKALLALQRKSLA
ncbi:ECF transporter S component [Anaeromassilibacillus senegalensis]|uniref:ECF transporter S component n=1 Tax=Anaeromassilibacillus senegalensis TaxID=1673717 RepID=UPI000680FD48|nr:ECF transporter S component [Anaeromassilibacillus senegalensis]